MSNQINKKENITDSSKNYTPPRYRANSFHCPHCDVYAHQKWYEATKYNKKELCKNLGSEKLKNYSFIGIVDDFPNNFYVQYSKFSFCDHCKKYSVWVDSQMVYPYLSTAPIPIDEMPESVKEIYNEARSISDKSPKAACALLRLSIEKLLEELKVNGKNLNDKIGNLVEKGLPDEVQEALDVVRVTGNKSIHPGQINVDDNPEIVNSLFELVNFICEQTIKKKQKIKNLFKGLPNNQKEAIKKRDS